MGILDFLGLAGSLATLETWVRDTAKTVSEHYSSNERDSLSADVDFSSLDEDLARCADTAVQYISQKKLR